MVEAFLKLWRVRDLRRKIFISLGLLLIARFLIFIPLPLIETSQIKEIFNQNAFLGFLNIFSGGGLENFSIVTMGVGPYITASIVMQLLTIIVPSLELLQKEGMYGQRKINQYTRLLTVPLGIIQGYAVILLLKQNGLISSWTPQTLMVTLLMLTAGTLFLMWMGELITENGVGNGVSLIITLGILGALPSQIRSLITTTQASGNWTSLLALVGLLLLTIVFVILINEAKRLIPVAYARRLANSGAFGSVTSHLPIKINTAGVIPIIFAIAMLTFPVFIGQFLSNARSQTLVDFATWLTRVFSPTTVTYTVSYALLVFIFTYFYTYIVFKPIKVAENLQKQGGFIPGVRPGSETVSYIGSVVGKITLFGGLFLMLVAILPSLVSYQFPGESLLLQGTSVLIVISVILETSRQIQAQYLMRTYDNYG